MADAAPSAAPAPACLPETASVYWRPRVDARRLRQSGHYWTATTFAHTVPLLAAAAALLLLEPLSFPLAAVLVAHAWIIPELYAKRGSNVLRPQKAAGEGPERTALGLLGDLIGHGARDLHEQTGLVIERGTLGTWLVGEAGAVLALPGGRRVCCYCVRVDEPGLPRADRIAHLLLALREDEAGFATVANMAFSGAPWRLRRRLPKRQRLAVRAAVKAARDVHH
ncbi:MAG: hypothetical protein QOE86_2873 [Solirubrobacteraceae bacterium]|nr:hypothetical protein [Solirubrobacteraceae bacterium]